MAVHCEKVNKKDRNLLGTHRLERHGSTLFPISVLLNHRQILLLPHLRLQLRIFGWLSVLSSHDRSSGKTGRWSLILIFFLLVKRLIDNFDFAAFFVLLDPFAPYSLLNVMIGLLLVLNMLTSFYFFCFFFLPLGEVSPYSPSFE